MVAVFWVSFLLEKKRRQLDKRRHALQQPFPDTWLEILKKNLPPYGKFSADQQKALQQDMKIFLTEKTFEGCGGLVLTDEIRVTIAAQACLLLLGRKDNGYRKLRSILVYPSAYVTGGKSLFGNDLDTGSVRLGESWGHGTVVLSWNDVKQGAFNFRDGHNVTMHEFAHQLDQEDGSADGAPILEERSAYSEWARVFSAEFNVLRQKTGKRKPSIFRAYGATNPAEFFAVATEVFFEKPRQFQKKHPELFQEMKEYYKVDPVFWV